MAVGDERQETVTLGGITGTLTWRELGSSTFNGKARSRHSLVAIELAGKGWLQVKAWDNGTLVWASSRIDIHDENPVTFRYPNNRRNLIEGLTVTVSAGTDTDTETRPFESPGGGTRTVTGG